MKFFLALLAACVAFNPFVNAEDDSEAPHSLYERYMAEQGCDPATDPSLCLTEEGYGMPKMGGESEYEGWTGLEDISSPNAHSDETSVHEI